MLEYPFKIKKPQQEKIREIPYLASSVYSNLEIELTLEFYYKRYVQPLTNFFDIFQSCLLDCGAGFGWFSYAYLLAGGKYAILADLDLERLQASLEIGRILGVDDKMEIVHASIQELPYSQDEIDIMVSIETLEHVGKKNIQPALCHIRDITAKGILLTTPNRLFPSIAHDTRLPFAHWLPKSLRRVYAKAFDREKMDHNNDFLSPWDLGTLLAKFKPATTCLTFTDHSMFKAHYPFYLPYNTHNKWQQNPGKLKSSYYLISSTLLGKYSYWVMPSLARIFVRK